MSQQNLEEMRAAMAEVYSPINWTKNKFTSQCLSEYQKACLNLDPAAFSQPRRGPDEKITFEEYKYTPLQVVIILEVPETDMKLKSSMVRELIDHSANYKVKDRYGNNIMHLAAFQKSYSPILKAIFRLPFLDFLLLERNSLGDTPLDILVDKWGHPTADIIKFILFRTSDFNTYHPLNNVGYAATLFKCKVIQESEDLLKVFLKQLTEKEMLTKENGKSLIHNLVSICDYLYPIQDVAASVGDWFEKNYVHIISFLLEHGFDIDEQDKCGNTALHLAVMFKNKSAMYALLKLGADVNLINDKDDTPMTMRKIFIGTNEYEFVYHVQKLLICELYVSKKNKNIFYSTISNQRPSSYDRHIQEFVDIIASVKNIAVVGSSTTLGDFLTEKGAVLDYPELKEEERNAVDHFFSKTVHGIVSLKPHVDIINLQYKKCRKRDFWIHQGCVALAILIPSFPRPYRNMVLGHLANFEIANMVKAACK